MDKAKDTSKSEPRALPDYIPAAVAEELQKDMTDMPKHLGWIMPASSLSS